MPRDSKEAIFQTLCGNYDCHIYTQMMGMSEAESELARIVEFTSLDMHWIVANAIWSVSV